MGAVRSERICYGLPEDTIGMDNALAGAPPACAWGYAYYNGACYPAR